ncbi:hypothetical protein RhiirB3_434563 [Rhizophagus irregularis]|nr:hypothetical protein RhiirB3_434563 [Rhizophagus irregularis]
MKLSQPSREIIKESKMSDTINLNYLIVPRGQTVNALEAVIQNNLGASFNYIPLDIRQIRMQSQVLISDYFNGDPPADYSILSYTL